MIRRLPIVGCPIKFSDAAAFLSGGNTDIEGVFSKYLGCPDVFSVTSATAGCYIILEALKKISSKKEVILPAYTASSLVLAVQKAGLKVRLCDISLKDFCLDSEQLDRMVNQDTLAIIGVHMFGLIGKSTPGLKARHPEVCFIEDCAQGLGSEYNGVPVGNLGDVSLFSFNRGKNIPAYGGGIISVNNKELSGKIKNVYQDGVAGQSCNGNLSGILKVIVLYLAMKPRIYGCFAGFISGLKEQAVKTDFCIGRFPVAQAALTVSLMHRIKQLSIKRYNNGMDLMCGLKIVENLIMPEILEGSMPAFNRLPILVRKEESIRDLRSCLSKAGIESSQMYYKPLHHQFDLGYAPGDFPNALYFAQHLLTLPAHPLLNDNDISRMISLLKGVFR